MVKINRGGWSVRYGVKQVAKYDQIRRRQKTMQRCKFCDFKKIKRQSVGIWKCHKCNTIYAGDAYNL